MRLSVYVKSSRLEQFGRGPEPRCLVFRLGLSASTSRRSSRTSISAAESCRVLVELPFGIQGQQHASRARRIVAMDKRDITPAVARYRDLCVAIRRGRA